MASSTLPAAPDPGDSTRAPQPVRDGAAQLAAQPVDVGVDGVLVAVSVPHGDDRLAGHQVGRRADRHHRQRLPQVELDDSQIGLGIARDQSGDMCFAGRQSDLDLLDPLDHVVIGEDVSTGVDHDAGAHAIDAARGSALSRHGC